MDFSKIDWNAYTSEIAFCSDHVTIRNATYSPTATNPTGEGRFHTSGQATYYVASGLRVAEQEMVGVPNAQVFYIQPGTYHVVDLIAAGEKYAELRHNLVAEKADGDWSLGQAGRNHLESLGVSGLIAPSAAVEGGENVILFRLDHKDAEPGFIRTTWDGAQPAR